MKGIYVNAHENSGIAFDIILKMHILNTMCVLFSFVFFLFVFDTKAYAGFRVSAVSNEGLVDISLILPLKEQIFTTKVPHYQNTYTALYLMRQFGINGRGDFNKALDIDGFDSHFNRKIAILSGKSMVKYIFFTYDGRSGERADFPDGLYATHFDGLSNVLYNISYLFSMPAKLLHGSFAVLAPTEEKERSRLADWLDLLLTLFIGYFLAFIMLPIGALIGTVFHPLQTLANLTFVSIKINILASFWDFLFGSIISPLWDVLGLFSVYWDIIKSIF
ncbi:MAG: hypothetical protein EOM23_08805 [Candidatus Moranbacteria bacterium]|nr:hypothetical protein [Candidatus Moranbacteria bacterium]